MNSPLLVCWCNRCCNIAKLPEFFPRWLNWRNMTGMQCCGQGNSVSYICVNQDSRAYLQPLKFWEGRISLYVWECLNLDRYSFQPPNCVNFWPWRCCEYLLLVLEQWFDSPEMQRSAELYEDLIKCCCGDAMSEVQLVLLSWCNTV